MLTLIQSRGVGGVNKNNLIFEGKWTIANRDDGEKRCIAHSKNKFFFSPKKLKSRKNLKCVLTVYNV